jgi:hypothetical protein
MDFRIQKGLEKSGAQLGGLTAAAGTLSFGERKSFGERQVKYLVMPIV